MIFIHDGSSNNATWSVIELNHILLKKYCYLIKNPKGSKYIFSFHSFECGVKVSQDINLNTNLGLMDRQCSEDSKKVNPIFCVVLVNPDFNLKYG